jgi:catechol 2,3-dioxygenase-like lactoylglutathione lyase family enzyme
MIENRFDHVGLNVKDLDATIAFLKVHTMAHIAFPCAKADFAGVVARVKELAAPIVSGPKVQRDGETILFRDPSGNIFEVCYPALTE